MSSEQKTNIALIDARVKCGQGKPGTEFGPKQLRTEYLYKNLQNLSKLSKFEGCH